MLQRKAKTELVATALSMAKFTRSTLTFNAHLSEQFLFGLLFHTKMALRGILGHVPFVKNRMFFRNPLPHCFLPPTPAMVPPRRASYRSNMFESSALTSFEAVENTVSEFIDIVNESNIQRLLEDVILNERPAVLRLLLSRACLLLV